MKEEKEIIHFEDGTTKKKETKEYTPNDGFIEDYQSINEIKKKYHKGYQTRTKITTNDPRIIRWFISSFCFIFFGNWSNFTFNSSMVIWVVFYFNKHVYIYK